MSFATASYVWLWLYSEMYGVIIYALEFFGFGGENKNLNVWKTGTSSMWAVNAMVTWKFFWYPNDYFDSRITSY